MLKRRESALRSIEDLDVSDPGRPASKGEPFALVVARPDESPSAQRPQGSPEARQAEAPQADTTATAPPSKRHRGRLIVLSLIGLIALAAGAWYGHYWWTAGRFIVSTDDAYVGVHAATLSAKVSGYVASVDVRDNESVHAGDVIARIDDGDYRLAVDSEQARIATQHATVERIGSQIAAQEAAVDAAKAKLVSAKAAETRTGLELTRQQALAGHAFASQQALEQAQAAREQAVAAVQEAEANVEGAQSNVAVLKAQQEEAQLMLKQLQTELAKAERDLSFTVIRAPFDGTIGNRAMQSGDYVQPGQRLVSLLPLADVYVDANFKETQLADLRPGQVASIAVDALPEHEIKGRVVSLAPASGSVFSLLPPDNATGNFTKIVQRIPVRIAVPDSVAKDKLLRPGMSVVVSVNTKTDTPSPAEPETKLNAISAVERP